MKDILYLTKVLFTNSMMTFSSKKQKSKNKSKYLGVILLIVLALLIFMPMIIAGKEIGEMLAPFNMLEIIMKLLLPFSSIVLIVFSVFSIISTFFLSNDIETLLSMPLKPYQIIIAKFLNSLFTVYLIELMLFTPIAIGLGIGFECNILYYLIVLIVTIFLPIFPLSILGIVITSLMRYSALSKMKDKMQYFIMAFAIIFAVALELLTQSMETNMVDGSDIAAIIDSTYGKTANIMSSIMFFTYPASIALSSSKIWLSLLLTLGFIIVSLLGLFLFAMIGQKIYIKGILGKPQIRLKKNREAKTEIKEEKQISIFRNLVSNEWKLMWRSPTFNMNLISTVIIVPLIFVISFGIGFINGGSEVSLSEMVDALKYLIDFDSAYVMTFTIAIFSFFTCFSPVSSTAISRDGKHAWYNKIMPIEPMKIIYAKMFWGIVLGFAPVLLIVLAVTILGILNVLQALMVIVPIFLLVILTNFIGIIIDLAKPKLNWDSEQYAVKQNLNGLYFMLIDWGITILIVLLGVLLIDINLPNYVISILLTLLFGAICVILNKLLNKRGLEVFKNIG